MLFGKEEKRQEEKERNIKISKRAKYSVHLYANTVKDKELAEKLATAAISDVEIETDT